MPDCCPGLFRTSGFLRRLPPAVDSAAVSPTERPAAPLAGCPISYVRSSANVNPIVRCGVTPSVLEFHHIAYSRSAAAVVSLKQWRQGAGGEAGLQVEPFSVKHAYEGAFNEAAPELSTCNSGSMKFVTNKEPPQPVEEGGEVIYTYDVLFLVRARSRCVERRRSAEGGS